MRSDWGRELKRGGGGQDDRGRNSEIVYRRFPDDTDLDILVMDCQRRNGHAKGPLKLDETFKRASEL
jgi:hypothetical protein